MSHHGANIITAIKSLQAANDCIPLSNLPPTSAQVHECRIMIYGALQSLYREVEDRGINLDGMAS